MQDINWYTIYTPKERMNKFRRKINKVLEIIPITQQIPGSKPDSYVLKALQFEMTGARVDPETKELLLVLKPKD